MRTLVLVTLLALTGCQSLGGTPDAVVASVDAAAQHDLDEALKVVQQAEPKVEFLCEVLPKSPACGVLTETINKFYAVAVFVQDSIDAGNDVSVELTALTSIAQKLLNAAEMAYRSVA